MPLAVGVADTAYPVPKFERLYVSVGHPVALQVKDMEPASPETRWYHCTWTPGVSKIWHGFWTMHVVPVWMDNETFCRTREQANV